jgi:hypothetical protein
MLQPAFQRILKECRKRRNVRVVRDCQEMRSILDLQSIPWEFEDKAWQPCWCQIQKKLTRFFCGKRTNMAVAHIIASQEFINYTTFLINFTFWLKISYWHAYLIALSILLDSYIGHLRCVLINVQIIAIYCTCKTSIVQLRICHIQSGVCKTRNPLGTPWNPPGTLWNHAKYSPRSFARGLF